ncbi:exopolysaccharide biosynthesis polyprenyl glycosylphosphotransferase [Urechidicola vernalis]|uniref:Exopolysaccharide biosynthesis polyprenyl glycosylphosphotransferase n=1 Tax=Urechidicola vernalis TaxID=3075600 RepID=A0ABU2Y7J4_9FLAO|nr:exopolysaccharide biosynthesis polyprenyl glycosylphosphotransferase [Urechidicola sp. P050]MDT0554166.1 exopolysaccharide biosynthesis polyprenyl glycosylphosphotransferase [Urechidicola sp. P050]
MVFFFYYPELFFDWLYVVYFNLAWLILSSYTKFYHVYRYTKLTKVISLLFIHFTIFVFIYLSYFTVFKEGLVIGNQFISIITIFFLILISKIIKVVLLRNYRIGGGNIRKVVILGGSPSVNALKTLFQERKYLGYDYKGFFSDKNKHEKMKTFLGSIMDSFEFILKNGIDEIYCSVSDFKRKELNQIIEFGAKHGIGVKLIPSSIGMFRKGLEVEYYDYVPVLSLRKLPFDNPLIKHSKRAFDVLFSTLVIVFVLSWLSIVLFIIIKIESKGPLVFKQVRDGLNGDQFECFKFRSMAVNKDADNKMATKGDMRITRVGRFIRKTSIDELPQFINVFMGDMSVVGPRPHMISQSRLYSKTIDRYLERNLVKPGVTGLAQIRGMRGEIEQQSDMENRVRLDLFYINNWSFFLDLKIIIQTVLNALQGEDKAY